MSMTEAEKCKQGLWYDANFDEELVKRRTVACDLCYDFNALRPSETAKQQVILKKLIGDHTFINHNAYLMDCADITIGKWCFFGPNLGLYTAIHPMLAKERNLGLEKALPITIGDNVWFGANVTVLPGVTIGSNTVIGAGSVVTHDIPDGVVAFGNPCKVIREITEEDSINYKK